MPGFGVHTFRLYNAQGRDTFVKFHWVPKCGDVPLLDDEAVMVGGKCHSHATKDLYEAISAGDYPEWELKIQAGRITRSCALLGGSVNVVQPCLVATRQRGSAVDLGPGLVTGALCNGCDFSEEGVRATPLLPFRARARENKRSAYAVRASHPLLPCCNPAPLTCLPRVPDVRPPPLLLRPPLPFLQTMNPADANKFDFDPLDVTKTWPEDLFPLHPVGRMVLNRNPDNVFSENEQAGRPN
eukprot:3564-Chlamydomonas_euryale.AAC.1